MRVPPSRGQVQWLISGGYLMVLLGGLAVGTPQAWRVGAALAAALALAAWHASLRRARAIADTPTSAVASAAQGYVELFGRARPAGDPLAAPLNGLPCLWYRFKVERRNGDKWETVSAGESFASFYLDDGSGRCLVDPEGAEILPRAADVWRAGDLRHTQAVLTDGERIYVLGDFRTLGGDGLQLDARADVGHLLAEWKRERPRLLERFDLDGDGEIDAREWGLARAQARREVERTHRELRAAPDTHVVGRPADGRPFLIAARPPEALHRHYRRWALAHLAIFFLALTGIAASPLS